MSSVTVDRPVVKSRRRAVAKSPKPSSARSIKIGLYLTPENARRLGVTAMMESRDRSSIVDELIGQHLRKYSVHTRGDRDTILIDEESAVA